MSELQVHLIEFHQSFDHPINGTPTADIPEDRVRLRANLMIEECLETLEAMFNARSRVELDMPGDAKLPLHAKDALQQARILLNSIAAQAAVDVDLVALADGLGDQDVINEGTRLEFGIEGDSIAREIHRSNMAKLWPCPECEGKKTVFMQVNDTDARDVTCGTCKGSGHMTRKREDGKTLKPDGWTPPNISGLIDKQRAGKATSVRDKVLTYALLSKAMGHERG